MGLHRRGFSSHHGGSPLTYMTLGEGIARTKKAVGAVSCAQGLAVGELGLLA